MRRNRRLKVPTTVALSRGQSNKKSTARVEAASTYLYRIQRKFTLNKPRRITKTTGTFNELLTTDDCRKTDCREQIVE